MQLSLGCFIGYTFLTNTINSNTITPYGIWVYTFMSKKKGTVYQYNPAVL